ncbi:MAG: hypothetical protein HY359_13425 [Candidatus Rokubacteria bacterium]|nr:hypothetical protein [Candidatus Rokubacteria bacterium]
MRLWVGMGTLFVAGRVAYWLMGVRFDAVPLRWLPHYLDPELLGTDLLRSLFYLHSQPPLFNLFLGGLVQWVPGHVAGAGHAVYLALGALLYATLFVLMRELGVSTTTAVTLASLCALSPAVVLYENWLYYAFPVSVLLTVSALLLSRVLTTRRTWAAAAFFACVFALAATWSVFHLAYYLASAAAVVYLSDRRDRRRLLLISAIPFLVLTSLYAKNGAVFGRFTLSSWMGMNLARITTEQVPLEERRRLIARGTLSPVSLQPPFAPLEAYGADSVKAEGFEDVPALSQVKRSTGFRNYNHLGYIAVSDRYLGDAIQVVRHHPTAYLRGLGAAWLQYLRPSHDFYLLMNLPTIGMVTRLYDSLVYGRVSLGMLSGAEEPEVYLGLLAGIPLLVGYGLWRARAGDAAGDATERARRAVIAYACLNVVYVAVVGNAFEVGENNRFRFVTEPLCFVLAGLFVHDWLVPRVAAFWSRHR